MADPRLTLSDARNRYRRAIAGSPYSDLESEDLLDMIAMDLPEVIDPKALVNYHEARKRGVNPNRVKLVYVPDPEEFGVTDFGGGPIQFGDAAIDFFERYPQYLPLWIAHEMTHTWQPQPRTMLLIQNHSRDPYEIEAFFWESQQAAKEGFSREEYLVWIQRGMYHGVYQDRIDPRSIPFVTKDLEERMWATMPIMSRRPVRVRGHKRKGASKR